MNQTSVKGYLRFIGDPARGPKYECEIWRASVRADGAIGFISDEYSSFTLTGDIESDALEPPQQAALQAHPDRVMAPKHILGSQTVTPSPGAGQWEQDFRFLALVKQARIDEVVLRPGESPEAFARRLLEAAVASGAILELLGDLLVPQEAARRDRDAGEAWTREMGAETARFLGRLRDPADKAAIRSLVLSLLIFLSRSGILFLWTSTTCSGEAIPTDSNPSATQGAAGP